MGVAEAFAFPGISNAEEAAETEAVVAAMPVEGGCLQRARLFGYYCSLDAPTELDVEKKLGHLRTLIQLVPWEPVLAVPLSQDEARHVAVADTWRHQAQLHERRADVLTNAAMFLQNWDFDEAKSLLLAAIDLEPNEWRWRLRLGRVLLDAARRDSRREVQIAREALFLFREAATRATTRESEAFLDGLTESAFLIGDATAAEYAESALAAAEAAPWAGGNLVHMAHTVLGALAFDAGDRLLARWHLEQSLVVPKSPQFAIRGPSSHLLKKFGEEDTTRSYLSRWQANFGLPDGWSLPIRPNDENA